MLTSIVLLALSGTTVPSAPAANAWKVDYTEAVREGRLVRRPLAVWIGEGPNGWQQVCKDSKLSHETHELLASKYVCLYIDRGTTAGRKLAADFEITDGPGLVISDRDGDNQAFRHAGALSGDDLSRQLRRYADPERKVVRTETLESGEVRYYYSPQPVSATPTFSSFGTAPVRGGSC